MGERAGPRGPLYLKGQGVEQQSPNTTFCSLPNKEDCIYCRTVLPTPKSDWHSGKIL